MEVTAEQLIHKRTHTDLHLRPQNCFGDLGGTYTILGRWLIGTSVQLTHSLRPIKAGHVKPLEFQFKPLLKSHDQKTKHTALHLHTSTFV